MHHTPGCYMWHLHRRYKDVPTVHPSHAHGKPPGTDTVSFHVHLTEGIWRTRVNLNLDYISVELPCCFIRGALFAMHPFQMFVSCWLSFFNSQDRRANEPCISLVYLCRLLYPHEHRCQCLISEMSQHFRLSNFEACAPFLQSCRPLWRMRPCCSVAQWPARP